MEQNMGEKKTHKNKVNRACKHDNFRFVSLQLITFLL